MNRSLRLIAGLALSLGMVLSTGAAQAALVTVTPGLGQAATVGIGDTVNFDVRILFETDEVGGVQLDTSVTGVNAASVVITAGNPSLFGGAITLWDGGYSFDPVGITNVFTLATGGANGKAAFFESQGVDMGGGTFAPIGSFSAVADALGEITVHFNGGPLVNLCANNAANCVLNNDLGLGLGTGVTVTPEPGSLALLGLGLAGMAFLRRRSA